MYNGSIKSSQALPFFLKFDFPFPQPSFSCLSCNMQILINVFNPVGMKAADNCPLPLNCLVSFSPSHAWLCPPGFTISFPLRGHSTRALLNSAEFQVPQPTIDGNRQDIMWDTRAYGILSLSFIRVQTPKFQEVPFRLLCRYLHPADFYIGFAMTKEN